MRKLIVALGLVAAVSCHDDHHAGLGTEPNEYVGCASDENWVTFDDVAAMATPSATQGPVFTMPAGGMTLTTKPIVAWKQNASTEGMAGGDVPHDGPGCTNCCPQYSTGALTTLHLPAISGNAYDLQFTIDGKVVYRVITTLQEWTPPDAVWTSWKGKTLSLDITRITLLRNDVKEGPFKTAAPLTFTAG